MYFMLEIATHGGPRKGCKECDDMAISSKLIYVVYCRNSYGLPQSRPCHSVESVRHRLFACTNPQVVMLRERAYFTPKQQQQLGFLVVKVLSSGHDNKLS